MDDSQPPLADIDHLLTHVADIEQAAATYRSLGFTLTPPSRIEPMGIVNQLVLLTPATEGAASFIELMSAFDRPKLPPAMAGLLSGEERIKSMVMLSRDAGRSHAALTRLGYPFAPPIHVKREWRLSADEAIFPEFDVLLPVEAPLIFNACRYHNVELYLREEWRRHPNTAIGLDAIFAVASDPAGIAGQYARLFGCAVEVLSLDHVSVAPARTTLQILTPARFISLFGFPSPALDSSSAAYVGFGIEVASLAACRLCLERNGVAIQEIAGGLLVKACGNIVRFRQM
jgi:hypothetical protein